MIIFELEELEIKMSKIEDRELEQVGTDFLLVKYRRKRFCQQIDDI